MPLHSFEATHHFGTEVELIALRSTSVLHLAWFLPFAVLRTAFSLMRGRVSRVVCGDAITWAAVAPLVVAAHAKGTVMVLGLDLSFPNPLYQRWIRWTLPKADRVVAISEATAATALERGIEPARVAVVNLGVRSDDVGPQDRVRARAALVRRFDLDAESLIVVTLGRLVRRKGVRSRPRRPTLWPATARSASKSRLPPRIPVSARVCVSSGASTTSCVKPFSAAPMSV